MTATDLDRDARLAAQGGPLPAPPALAGRSLHQAGGPGLRIRTHARLHLGFLDPDAALGRRFGSVGLAIDGLGVDLTVRRSDRDQLSGSPAIPAEDLARIDGWLARLRQASGRDEPLSIRLDAVLPSHQGFGSGTQLALALGRAFADCLGIAWRTRELASALGRGGRSGIGIAAFDAGGLLVDGGHRVAPPTRPPPSRTTPSRTVAPGQPPPLTIPPLLARQPFPPAWRVIVLLEAGRHGLHGAAERRAIEASPPFPPALAAAACHHVLMQILPGAADQDFPAFAAGINRLQQLAGEHFAQAQGGLFTSPAVARVIDALAARVDAAGAAFGQSSWGPTAFAIVPSAAEASRLVTHLVEAGLVANGPAGGFAGLAPGGPSSGSIRALICRGVNSGALTASGRR